MLGRDPGKSMSRVYGRYETLLCRDPGGTGEPGSGELLTMLRKGIKCSGILENSPNSTQYRLVKKKKKKDQGGHETC